MPSARARWRASALAFDYADSRLAHVDQGGLFDDGADDHASSTQEPALTPAEPWSVKERLTLEKTAIGYFLSGHLFDQSADEVRRFARRPVVDLADSREPQLVAGIVSDLRIINGQRGRMALFKIDDGSGAIETVATDELLQAHRDWLKDDELVVLLGKVQNDRFSGGLRLTVQQVWDLAAARCRFGKYLRVDAVGGLPPVAEVLREFPSRRVAGDDGIAVTQGLPVRLALRRPRARGEVDLGDDARFYPSDDALARWRAEREAGQRADRLRLTAAFLHGPRRPAAGRRPLVGAARPSVGPLPWNAVHCGRLAGRVFPDAAAPPSTAGLPPARPPSDSSRRPSPSCPSSSPFLRRRRLPSPAGCASRWGRAASRWSRC